MVRKATARRDGSGEADAGDGGPDEPARRPRAGSGGRWWVWVGRAILWAFLLVVIANGIWMPIRDGLAQPPQQNEDSTDDEPTFPTTAASAFAARFADAYLNAGGDSPDDRAEALSEFVPEGEADSFDLSNTSLTGDNVEVIAVDAKDDHNAVVTLSAHINGEPMSLDVPVYAEDATSLVVSGQPALLAAPDKAELPDPSQTDTDSEAREELEPFLTDFFEAYAQTPEHLSRYTEQGANITELPGGSLEFANLDELTVPAGDDGEVRETTASVVWRLAGSEDEPATLTQNYQVDVVRTDNEWYVRDIQGAPPGFGD